MESTIEITKALNIAFSVDGLTGPIQVFAVPFSHLAFKHHFRLISRVYSVLALEGLTAAGPTISAMLAIEEAEKQGEPERAAAFLDEIRRSACIFAKHEGKYQPVPLQLALDRNLLDQEGASEVENLIAFFTCLSAMLPRRAQPDFARGLMSACSGRTTHLSIMEFAASLQT